MVNYTANGVTVPVDHLRELVKRATRCEYFLKIECTGSLSGHGWWIDYFEKKITWLKSSGTFCALPSKYPCQGAVQKRICALKSKCS